MAKIVQTAGKNALGYNKSSRNAKTRDNKI